MEFQIIDIFNNCIFVFVWIARIGPLLKKGKNKEQRNILENSKKYRSHLTTVGILEKRRRSL